ncbi:Aste57867_21204 [Aphanomyces stellatus]|uniref:Aste57867_21204 protein n=1 Tax=Aphanomyces stellatus TaxID=120398 RepID=A0A485LGX2_9STRA|nr:hypothetical protein As57867_021136 [Aphanomyces stellatus]VFT97877.1 Aste57867_21204 [Aphanomyces stellatus]
MIPLGVPSKTWQEDQVPYVVVVAFSVAVVNHYQVSIINIYLPDDAPVHCTLQPIAVANALAVIGLIFGFSYGVCAFPIVFMLFLVWMPLWFLLAATMANRILPRFWSYQHLQVQFTQTQRLAGIAKLSMMPLFMAIASVAMMVIAVGFVSISNSYHPHEEAAIAMEVGLLVLTHGLHAVIPWLRSQVFKFPLRSTTKFIHFQTELIIASFLHLAFPRLQGVLKLALILVTEVAQTVLSLLFLFNPFVDLMLHPDAHGSKLLVALS